MSSFTKLISKIRALLEMKSHAVVAISGFGRAGKSHLADRLRDYFKIKNGQVIRIDNLSSTNPNGSDIFDQS